VRCGILKRVFVVYYSQNGCGYAARRYAMDTLLIMILITVVVGVVLSGRTSPQPQVIYIQTEPQAAGGGCVLLVVIALILFLLLTVR
jgi:hypothetical protein